MALAANVVPAGPAHGYRFGLGNRSATKAVSYRITREWAVLNNLLEMPQARAQALVSLTMDLTRSTSRARFRYWVRVSHGIELTNGNDFVQGIVVRGWESTEEFSGNGSRPKYRTEMALGNCLVVDVIFLESYRRTKTWEKLSKNTNTRIIFSPISYYSSSSSSSSTTLLRFPALPPPLLLPLPPFSSSVDSASSSSSSSSGSSLLFF